LTEGKKRREVNTEVTCWTKLQTKKMDQIIIDYRTNAKTFSDILEIRDLFYFYVQYSIGFFELQIIPDLSNV